MNKLSNLVTVEGNYNNILTELTSNTSVVNMIEGLTVTKEADKQNWASGNLTYTITINLGDILPSTSSKITFQVKKKV